MPLTAMPAPHRPTRKVLYFINDLFGGGAQKGLINLLEADFFSGAVVHVAAMMRGDGCIEEELLRYLPATQLHIFSPAEKMRLKHLLLAFLRYPLLLLKLRPQAVILSLPQANLVGRFWGHLLPFFRLYAFEHTTSYAKKSYAYLLKALSLSVTGIIMDTHTTGAETTRFFLPFRRYTIIDLPLYTGTVNQAYVKSTTRITGIPKLLIAGRLTTAKNHTGLLKALKILKDDGTPCHLSIAGNGELTTALTAEVAKLGLTKDVTFLGYLSPWTTECPKADIYLQPSHREGLCITVVEAMRHGLPVIASPRGGMLDYGVENENIVFADPDSPTAIAAQISRVVTDDTLRAKLAKNALTSMEARFGTAALGQKLAIARAALGLPATPATKPTIVQVVEAFGGGVFQSLSQLCNGLKDSANFVIVHDIRAETPTEIAPHFPTGTRFIHLPMGRAVKPSDVARAAKLRKLLLSLNPHAVHAHSSKAGALVRMALLGTTVPRFYSPRGYGFQMKSSSAPKRAFYWVAERALGFLPATTVACGYGELPPAKWVSWKAIVIPNAIDPDAIPTANRQRPPFKGTLQVVSSGRITPQKNFPLFCDIARHFLNQPVQFTWVGGGDIDPTLAIPANVTITGWLAHAEGLKQLNKGHVYLHMSGWEGLSRIVLEAMAHGFPLVVSDIPANRELASANNGFICKNGPEAMAALEQFLANPILLTDMSKASLRHLTETYNWNHVLKSWKQLYKVA